MGHIEECLGSPNRKRYYNQFQRVLHIQNWVMTVVQQDSKIIIFNIIDPNDTEAFPTIGTQTTTEISKTTPIFTDEQNLYTHHKATKGTN